MPGESLQCVVMFADVAGSTAMYENLGDIEARQRISKALNTLITICKRHKGKLVKTIGDEILVYFLDVDLSMLASKSMQEAMENNRSPETIGLSIRIGLHYGSVIMEENDIFGDTVNVAARVTAMTKGKQVLFTGVMAKMITSADLTYRARQYDRIKVKGKGEMLDVYMFAWEQESDITNMATASSFTNPSKDIKQEILSLSYQELAMELKMDSNSVQLGRGKECEIRIIGDLTSRFHAKIEVRRGKFVLTDQSTNGTFVRSREGQNVFLRQEELTLFGSGFISLGKSIEKAGDNVLQYSCD